MTASRNKNWFVYVLLATLLLGLAACGGSNEPAAPANTGTDLNTNVVDDTEAPAVDTDMSQPADTGRTDVGLESDAAEVKSEFFSQDQYQRSLDQLEMQAASDIDNTVGSDPWVQVLNPEWVDTAEYAQEGPYTFCFSNAGVNNPWRVVGWTTMQAEVDLHPEIEEFIHVDAEGSDEKQIADIADLVASGNCDVLIVSPNTTAALTPAVEQACQELPVIVFDRGVFTDCPVSFVQPIGGYAFGHEGAEFIVDNCDDDCKVLALRILPGVDVLEERWAAAKRVFEVEEKIDVIGVEFGDGDNAKVKSIVNDYLDRFGEIDAIWMDAGATAVAALEAFEDRGLDYPIIVGEDQQDFLVKWQSENLTGIAPTFPTYQWRTPVIAGMRIMQGEQVPAIWRLPQPAVTQQNLDQFVQPNMPPLHYAMCGCENMPDFPARWGGR